MGQTIYVEKPAMGLSAQSHCSMKEIICTKQTHDKFASNNGNLPFDESPPKQGSSQGERRRGGEELRRPRWSSPPPSSASEMVLPPRKRQFAPNRPTVKFHAQSINLFSCYFLVANKKVTKEVARNPGSGPPCLMFAQCQKSHVH